MAKGGEFVLQLFPDKAPLTVNSFVFLAREKFFDGTTFHRVLDGFMAQGGDPMGTGGGDPGYEFVNEDSDLTFDKPGVLAMANAGRDTNGSQFFITFVPTPQLNGGYTIFGQVISGMDVVNGITRRDPQSFPNYTGDVIESITITEE
jgi:cyclophilin family peptidyl-prolyl cis-trans isomerase